ncbi:MAG: phosphate acyltransferase, partial [Clostridia bacterium]
MLTVKTKIIVDAMGGDNAPDSVVRGAIAGAKKHDVDIILVGDKSIIETILKKEDLTGID